MPTPLARLLRAMGGGRPPATALSRIPNYIVPCTNAAGADYDLPIRAVLNDLTPDEELAYAAHRHECEHCQNIFQRALQQDWSELRELLRDLDINPGRFSI